MARSPIRVATSNIRAFSELTGACLHRHASSATTAAVTSEVTSAVNNALGSCVLRSLGFSPLPLGPSKLHLAQVAAGLQPRKAHINLVPEFRCQVQVYLNHKPPMMGNKLSQDIVLHSGRIPKGSKLLTNTCERGEGSCSSRQHGAQNRQCQGRDACSQNQNIDQAMRCQGEEQTASLGHESTLSLPDAAVLNPKPPSCPNTPMVTSSETGPPRLTTLRSPVVTIPETGLPILNPNLCSAALTGDAEREQAPSTPAKRGRNVLAMTPPKVARCTTHEGKDTEQKQGKAHTLDHVSFQCHAERLANDIGDDPSADDLVHMFENVTGDQFRRMCGHKAGEKAWSSGAYAKGGCVGLRKNTASSPKFTRACVAFLKRKMPDATFSCVSIFCNLLQGMRKDSHNMKGTLNFGVALSAFRGGHVWHSGSAGNVRMTTPSGKQRGALLDVAAGPISFDASAYHCVMPWEGRRIVLIGYTPQCDDRMTQDECELLRSLGFPLPWDKPAKPCIKPPPSPADGIEHSKASASNEAREAYTFGVYHTEAEFIRKAVEVGHPRQLYGQLPEAMKKCIDALLVMPEAAVAKKRALWFSKWTERARAIMHDPDPTWEISDPAMSTIMQKKRLQLLDEIVQTEGYGDTSLAANMRDGFDLVGTAPTSGVLPGKVVPASMDPESLSMNAARANEALRTAVSSCGDNGLDEALWNKTKQEVQDGWLLGPYEWDELDVGNVMSPRFPLQQKNKVRPIDDYSRSGVNACVTNLEQQTVDTADVAAAMFSKLSNGLIEHKRSGALLGRSFNLTAAYRQLCVSKESSRFAT